MREDIEIAVGEADRALPSGQNYLASPTATNTEIAAAKAGECVPKSHSLIADAAATRTEGAAATKLPQGQRRVSASLALTPIASGDAMPTLPRGRHSRASPEAILIEGAAQGSLPHGRWARAASLDLLCGQLMQLQRDRTFAIRQQIRCDNAVLAYVRRCLGFTTDTARMSDTERKNIAAEARRIVKAVETGEDLISFADEASASVILSVSPVILRGQLARQVWDEMRTDTEKRMRKLARELPAWSFAQQVKGLSDLGLAVIVGEAHDLSGYPTKGHLWKRLGLSVIDGVRQGNPGAGATAEDWVAHGYVARRRAEVFAFIDDVVLRAQWRGAKDDVPAHAIGPYGEYYGRKKAEYIDRGWSLGHADKAARRYMAKMLIRDIWKAWRGAAVVVSRDQRLICPSPRCLTCQKHETAPAI